MELPAELEIVEGPTGPRERLKGTRIDLWELVATVEDNGGDLGEAADYLSLNVEQAEAAMAYYRAHPEETDRRIRRNREEGMRAERAWREKQITGAARGLSEAEAMALALEAQRAARKKP